MKKIILVVAVLALTVASSGGCLAATKAATKWEIGKNKTYDKILANTFKNCLGTLSSDVVGEYWNPIPTDERLDEVIKATMTGEVISEYPPLFGTGIDLITIPNNVILHGGEWEPYYSPSDDANAADTYGLNMGQLTCNQFVFGNMLQDSKGWGGTWYGIVGTDETSNIQKIRNMGYEKCPDGESFSDTDLCLLVGNDDNNLKIAKKLFNLKDEDSLALNSTEMFNIYIRSLGNSDNNNLECSKDMSQEDGWYNVHAWVDGKYTEGCWVQQKSEMDNYVFANCYGSNGELSSRTDCNSYYFDTMSGTTYVGGLEALVDKINQLAKSELVDPGGVLDLKTMSTLEITKESGGTSWTGTPFIYNGVGDVCKNSGGSGIFGWFLCPIMSAMGNAATGIYDEFLKPQLEVNPTLIGATDEDNSAMTTWRMFQNMANIAFSIILLVVIFSQLTGRGVDNYGVKKILPKLVITAMLVNLSFVVCQVAVDLSNILGNSLQNLLSSVASENTTVMIVENKTTVAYDTVGTDVMTGVFLAGLFVSGTAGMIAIYRNPALLLALLLGLIGVVVAVFFIFIILAARQAAVLILIVISPLAFVCYALPNTKKLFDKWLKLMQALLMVYPICGLLIGGGDFVSRLLLNAGGAEVGFGVALTAMLASVVPLFFIPTVLKNSMSALGGLGAKISGLGNKVSGGAKGALKNTRTYKNAQERGKARGDRKFAQARAGIRFDKDGKPVESGNPIARLRRRTAGTAVGRFFGTDAAMGEQQAKLRSMEEKRQQNAMTAEVGVAPLAKSSNLKQKMQNAVNEAVAENEVPVVPVAVDLAIQRRRSATKAQETKNFMDQFAEMSNAELRRTARVDFIDKFNSAGTAEERGVVLNGVDGGAANSTQEMQALIATMASREMDGDVADILEAGGDAVGNNSDVMKTLAKVGNVSFRAYGKNGEGVSYVDFMRGENSSGQKLYRDNITGKVTVSARDEQNNANAAVSMGYYVANRSDEFLDGLDSEALLQIAKFQAPEDDSAPRVQIMSGDMIAKAESVVKAQNATSILDNLVEDGLKHGQKIEFSTAQYMNLNTGTRKRLNRLATEGNMEVRRNLIKIARTVEASPMLKVNLSSGVQDELKLVRQKWDSGYNNNSGSDIDFDT